MPPKPMAQKRVKTSGEVPGFDADMSGWAADIINHSTEEFVKMKNFLTDEFKAVKDAVDTLNKKTDGLISEIAEVKKEVGDQSKIIRFIREEQNSIKSINEAQGKSLNELISKMPYRESEVETISTATKLGSIDKVLNELREKSDKLSCQVASADASAKSRETEGFEKIIKKVTKIAVWMNDNLVGDEG